MSSGRIGISVYSGIPDLHFLVKPLNWSSFVNFIMIKVHGLDEDLT